VAVTEAIQDVEGVRGLGIATGRLPKEIVAEGNEALATALGMGETQLEPLGVDVGDTDVGGFGETEPAAIDGHEEGPSERITVGADGEKTFDLVGTVDAWKLERTPRGPDA
jgi:hypothetical protein